MLCTSRMGLAAPLLLLCVVAPALVLSCSCPQDAFQRSRSQDIRDQFCDSYGDHVYTGVVTAATCNCIPGERVRAEPPSLPVLNCQHYLLEPSESAVNTTLIASGQCDSSSYYYANIIQLCSTLRNSLGATNVTVEGPVQSDDEVPVGPTPGPGECSFSCPHNVRERGYEFLSQPCVYSVRVEEVFKGSYVVGQVIEEIGPDVQTTCGYPGNLLQIANRYVAGIGSVCSSIGEWSALSGYNAEELQLLRTLREEGCDTATGTTSSATESTMQPATPVVSVILTVGSSGTSLSLHLLILPIAFIFPMP